MENIKPYILQEIEHLVNGYKKTEYTCHRKHHHNIQTMDKFKNLISGTEELWKKWSQIYITYIYKQEYNIIWNAMLIKMY